MRDKADERRLIFAKRIGLGACHASKERGDCMTVDHDRLFKE